MSDLSWDVELVNDLAKLADEKNPNRAAMAHLRRGLERPPDYILEPRMATTRPPICTSSG